MKSLHQDEIIKLEDQDLQLQYILGGLYPHGNLNCTRFWGCDIRCSTQPVPSDENFQIAKNFITKHNISNSTFLRLVRAYLHGTFNSYKGDWGNLIPELGRAILGYNFSFTNYESIKENDLKEQELIELIQNEANVEDSALNDFLKQYSLTTVDFMILAKTSINYQFLIARGFEKTDLIKELEKILITNDLYQPYEWVIAYRASLEEKPKSFLKRVREKFLRK